MRGRDGVTTASVRRGSRRLVTAAVALALSALLPTHVGAASTYYVATTGSDANPGTVSAPWKTIQKAANTAPAGSVVTIRGGSYAPFTVTRPALTFRPYGAETVIVDATSASPNAIRISATHDIVVDGLVAQSGRPGGAPESGSNGTSIAWVNGKGTTDSLATFRSWTGFEASGIQADPGFADAAFDLPATSPAIDRGSVISGITDGVLGAAPDLGRHELAEGRSETCPDRVGRLSRPGR